MTFPLFLSRENGFFVFERDRAVDAAGDARADGHRQPDLLLGRGARRLHVVSGRRDALHGTHK